jgi:RHS repeat-associated protein
MPASITQGTNTIQFQHDVDHQRVIQIASDGTTTIYLNGFGVSTELFSAGTSAARWTDYLSVGNAKVGMRITNIAAATVSTRYFHTDHLGSVSVITDENGAVVERLSYDAWGKRRFASGADDPAGSITSQSPRGFTGEEQLDTVGLVHLNGRVYDPLVGRMISADPTVPDPLNAQTWNRYSYVGNDPLAFTDPSGFNFFSSFFHAIGSFFNSVVNFFRQNFRAILQIAITVALNAILPLSGVLLAVASAAGGAAIATGLTGGNLSQVLRAGLIAGATAFAFFGVGEATNAFAGANPDPITGAHGTPTFGTDAYAFNVAGHALVGCGASVASGGSCASGALSGAAGSAAGPALTDLNFGARLAATAVLGGVASVAGGGKFANGAVTGAFGYLFNAAAGRLIGGYIGGALVGALGFESGPGAVLAGLAGRYVGGEFGSWLEDALTGPKAGTEQPWSGPITAGAVPDGGLTAYRIWGGDTPQNGAWLSPIAPDSSEAARSLLALPPQNSAEFISVVQIPAGTQIQYGTAAGAFGQPGGGVQIQLQSPIPASSFGPGRPLP